MRPGLIVLGIALGILWIAGLSANATAWMVWLVFALAIVSLVSAMIPAPGETTADLSAPPSGRFSSLLRASPFGIGVALLLLWIIGLATGAAYWLTWWTFGFGIAYLLFGVAVSWPEERVGRPAGGPTTV